MTARLPIELLDLVVQNATTNTQANLSAVSRSLYSLSIRPLYASISDLSTPRAIQCLRTLSTEPQIARLVRSFSFELSTAPVPQDFHDLLTSALGNMSELTSLSLQADKFATSHVLSKVSSRLTKVVCVLRSDDTYPISKFLSSQPTIEQLHLVCQPEGLADLHPEALPALRDLSAPLYLAPRLLGLRYPRLSRLSVLGSIMGSDEFVILCIILVLTNQLELREVVMSVKLTALSHNLYLAVGLAKLGRYTPLLRLLRLEIQQGHLNKYEWDLGFQYTLSHFPNLRTLVVISQPPSGSAYIRNPPRVQLDQTSPSMKLTFEPSPNALRAHPSHGVLPPPSPHEVQDESGVVPDPLHDPTCHLEILESWHQVCPGLERVVFPVGTYTYVNKKESESG